MDPWQEKPGSYELHAGWKQLHVINLLVESEQMRFVLAITGIAALGIFLGILVYKVPRLDLGLISLIAFMMCVYDFYVSVKSNETH